MSYAIQLILFWRQNHFPSIACKSVFWATLAWTAISLMTDNQLALVGSLIIGGMSAVKYGLSRHVQTEKLRELCNGDVEKLSWLQEKLNSSGLAGMFMREMLITDVDSTQNDTMDLAAPLENELQANINASNKLIEKMARLTRAAGLGSYEHCIEIEADLLSAYSSGEYRIGVDELVSEFLPDNVMCICTGDYNDEGDHASLIEEFSGATNGIWTVTDCSSGYDQKTHVWTVRFTENGECKQWQIAQKSNELSKAFLQQVIRYTENRSGYTVTILDDTSLLSLVCLPDGMYDELVGTAVEMAA